MRIACVGDLHYSNLHWRSAELQRLNRRFYENYFQHFFAIAADLYVCLGDLTHFGTPGELKEILAIIAKYRRPDQRFEVVIGNHDILVSRKKTFQRLCGLDRLYRSFQMENWRLVFLDTARTYAFRKDSSLMSIAQSRWLCQEILDHPHQPMMVFAHHPAQQVTMTDQDRRYLIHLSLADVLKIKEGPAVYVNGHKHKYHYHVEDNWAFLQFNDILDDPSAQVLTLEGTEVSMETLRLDSPGVLAAAKRIGQGMVTFVPKKKKGNFAQVAGLCLNHDQGQDRYLLKLLSKPLSL